MLCLHPRFNFQVCYLFLIGYNKEKISAITNENLKKQFDREPTRLELLNLLEAIVIAKLPKLSRQELEIMFGVEDLRKTRFAQEMMAEGKLETIPPLLSKGFSVEEIAEILKLNAQQVREYINNMN